MPSLTLEESCAAALSAVVSVGPDVVTRPGQLRSRLVAELGDAATEARALVHQVVAAAEENLPGALTTMAPLTAQSLQRLSEELATARGWTLVVSERATRVWATALGFDELVSSSWPRSDSPELPPTTLPEAGE